MLIDALSADLLALELSSSATLPPTVAVIGPHPELRDEVRRELSNYHLVAKPDREVDVVVAVAPSTGWEKRDFGMLVEVFTQVGRLVVSHPLPSGVLEEAVLVQAGDVSSAVSHALSVPPLARLPQPEVTVWERIALRIEHSHNLLKADDNPRDPIAACTRLGMRPPMQWNATFAIELLVITGVAAVGLSRVFGGFLLCVVVAAVVLARGYVKQTQLRKSWARGQLRKYPAHIRFGRPSGSRWVRKQIAHNSQILDA